MSKQRNAINFVLLLLMLANLVGPAWALVGDDCQAPITASAEPVCCQSEKNLAPRVHHTDCNLGCFIVCERPQGVDPAQSLAFHSFQTPILVREFVFLCPPLVLVVQPSAAREHESLAPRELERPLESLPNPPPSHS